MPPATETLPAAVSLNAALRALFGEGVRVSRKDRLHGGDINDAYALSLTTGDVLFMKMNGVANAAFFRTEAAGLAALASCGELGVPRVLGFGTDEEQGFSFLLLEFLASGARQKDYWERFGRGLAALHRADCSAFAGGEKYGFTVDNFIGATPQRNAPHGSWAAFYRDCRLAPQLELAARYFDSRTRSRCTALLDRLDGLLPEPDFPSLLHGDLWSGNVHCGPDGSAWLIDPAAYCGCFEADIAMTQLFGGFPQRFYDAYAEMNPFPQGWRERLPLYHLYQLLNHLNLFGTGYLPPVLDIIGRYAG